MGIINILIVYKLILFNIEHCFTITKIFIFVFLSFISYLWIDDIEAKERKVKSIDNSLEWFWKKV